MTKPHNHFYEFGQFRIDPAERVLIRDGAPVTLPPKVFDTLLALVERHGHIVEKDELIQKLWPETFVEENNLSQYISAIRKSLGDGRQEQRYVETVPRRGYRFTGAVREIWDEQDELIKVSHTKMSLRIQEESETRDTIDVSIAGPSLLQGVLQRRKIILALTGVLVALAAFVGANRLRKADSKVSAASQIKTLAVLPLKSGNGEEQFSGLSIADDLITRLGQSLDVKIRPTNAVYKYVGAERDAIAAGRELSVDAVLDGEAQKVGERVRIKLRLLRTRDGSLLWESEFDDDLKNRFAAQDSVVEKVASEIFSAPANSLKLLHGKRSTTSVAAHEAYVRGRYYWNSRAALDLHRSITCFEQAITHDPKYALAFAGLADAYAFDAVQSAKAEATARKALQLDPSLGQPHATIGFVRWFWLWDWKEADREFKLATALSPDYATARQWYALFLAARTYFVEARAEMQRALELDPFSLPINADLGQILYFTGDFDGAIAQCHRTLALNPDFVNARIYLHQAYTQKGMYDAAIAEYFKVQKILDGNLSFDPKNENALRAAYAARGMRGFWQEQLKLDRHKSEDDTDFYRQAEFHALLGEKEEAVRDLEQAVEARLPSVIFARVNPAFKDLHQNARFISLLERLGAFTLSHKK